MFDNIIAQPAALQLREDFLSGQMAPSMLFYGPVVSGKGSSALELARVLSCEKEGDWNCSCPACTIHRVLLHSDLLMLGRRDFQSEIAACRAALLRELESGSRPCTTVILLFIRSVRKLTARFSPVLLENDSKMGKLSTALLTIEEGLIDFENFYAKISKEEEISSAEINSLIKLSETIQKSALSLESDGLNVYIPIDHIRRAAYWSRLAPAGKRKIILLYYKYSGEKEKNPAYSIRKMFYAY